MLAWLSKFGTKQQITEHFWRHEFKCPDGTPYPRKWLKTRLLPLCEQLEEIRKVCGNKPITITSGYRTREYNEYLRKKKIKAARNSQHIEGNAADIKIPGVSGRRLAQIVRRLRDQGFILNGGVGSYTTFCHYDIRGTKATWGFPREKQ